MKRTIQLKLLVLFVLVLQIGCVKKQTEVQPGNVTQKADLVTETEARKIAQNYNLSGAKITSITTAKVNGLAAVYIVNFERNQGYVLVSAEHRMSPVLAFNDKGSFTLEDTKAPGVSNWFQQSKQAIAQLRENGKPADAQIKARWERAVSLKRNARTTGLKYVSALTYSKWGQGCYYNAQTPVKENLPCQRAYTGCVATAVAQVLRYYYGDIWREGYEEAKNTAMGRKYDWTKMKDKLTENEPDSIKGIAKLMRDIGEDVNMYYTDNGSFSSARYYAYPRFQDTYGFDANTLRFLNYSADPAQVSQTVTEELDQKQLSVLVGYNDEGAGHVWVCDGYYKYDNSELFLHMNWGWDGRPDDTNGTNGWYLYNSFKPSGRTFNNRVGVITGFRVKP
ncbi:C10 family peptidase [uncultured Microscilla sp.]|uniref:C10 family peptidase n=1 Tax=uncultured Microscilla sp. TaxID=432653 RepID=UPI00263756EA|nr:C10 family peptidase [uncultured Microscilla sp.]